MFEENLKTKNEMRILRNASQRMSNLVKLSRYAEAEDTGRRLAGIFRAWELQKQLRRSAPVN